MKAVGYTRLSQKSDTSIPNQTERIESYAREHELQLIDVLSDGERASGFDRNREKYNEIVDMALDGEIDAIIVDDRSRLGRDQKQRVKHIIEFDDADVQVHTCQEGLIDTDEATWLIVESAHAHGDDAGKRLEIEKSKQATEKRIGDGYYHGRVPFGLEVAHDKSLQKNDEEWERLEEVWRTGEYENTTEWRALKRGREWYEERLERYR